MVARRLALFVVIVAALGACVSSTKIEIDEDFSELASVDQKSDYFSYRLQLLGTLHDGDIRQTSYTKTPRFRGFDFTGAVGDTVDAWIRSTSGDAVAWVLDGKFHVIAKNDDADATTRDAHLVATLPVNTTGRYYIVFRDYDLKSHPFTTTFHHATTAVDPQWDAAAELQVDTMVTAYSPLSPFAIAKAAMPSAAQARYDASIQVLEVPATFRISVQGRDVYVVVATDGSGEGNTVVVDGIDANNRWFLHGIAHTLWDGGGGLSWSLADDDTTICTCAQQNAAKHAGCRWLDDTVTYSTSITCP